MTGTPDPSEATRTWARIAVLSFGGPAGQIAVMHRILVEEKRWIGERRFLHALNFCMLLPGPEAQQLATYLGWLLNGTRGGLIAGGLFILPGLLSIMALSWLYALHGEAPLIAALFFGLKAGVLAIVFQAVLRLGKRALAGRLALAVSGASFLSIFALGVPFPVIVITAALIGLAAGRGSPSSDHDQTEEEGLTAPASAGAVRAGVVALALWLLPVALIAALAPGSIFDEIGRFFSQMAVVTFGGAYAALAWVAQEAVSVQGWLGPDEMLDGLGLAETTPGPLIMVLQFVGFLAAFREAGDLPPLLAGTLGGFLVTWVTFAPCFTWIFLCAPWMERVRGNPAPAAALSMVTAAVVGVILNLALWFAVHSLFAEVVPWQRGPLRLSLPVPGSFVPWSAMLTSLALGLVFGLRWGMGRLLCAMAAAGMVLHFTGQV
ncbi:chromate efflux transporter [Gemmobacter lutimaris]|uniref:Chromate efflux transporter n=1 Tax=Gemmobacter lutimaris TaxID=2306023 RepID=A0A398BKU3_9RHOB|nr:chromate efflux transporter [Gemmobacter lutimaris]RID91032.1 chromate efflux transporter [Gemmobacter lutimaris]